jgi:tRNA modification GTPase
VVVVLDRSEPLTPVDREVLALYPDALVVSNKSDRPAAWDAKGPLISAERGDGIDDLVRQIADRLVPDPPPLGAAVPFRLWQVRRLRRLAGQ